MAKGPVKSGGTSRIRFVMVEAEIADGDIGQITQAITNALRPVAANAAVKRIAVTIPQGNGELGAEAEVLDDAMAEEAEAVNGPAPSAKAKTPRKPGPKPSVIQLDLDAPPPLSSLGKFNSNHKRYLAIARWLHDHRGIEVITVDHIYTCYRHLSWPININDFAAPLRELKFKQYFTQPETGKYAINQLGLAKAAEAGD